MTTSHLLATAAPALRELVAEFGDALRTVYAAQLPPRARARRAQLRTEAVAVAFVLPVGALPAAGIAAGLDALAERAPVKASAVSGAAVYLAGRAEACAAVEPICPLLAQALATTEAPAGELQVVAVEGMLLRVVTLGLAEPSGEGARASRDASRLFDVTPRGFLVALAMAGLADFESGPLREQVASWQNRASAAVMAESFAPAPRQFPEVLWARFGGPGLELAMAAGDEAAVAYLVERLPATLH